MDFQVLTELFENINTKYPESKYISDLFKNLNVNIGNINSFNEVRNPDVLVRALNILKQLDDSLKEEVAVKASYESHREQVKFLNSTNSTLEKLKSDSETLSTEIQNLKSKVDSTNSIIEELQSNLQTQSLYLETYKESERLVHDLSTVADNLEIYLKKSSKAVDSMNQIQQLENDISVYKNELIPVKNAISDINGRLTLLNSYYQEYETYNASYKIIETLKKYCSPTGGGIQTIFMQLYMEKTLQLSNQILSMLFGGEYQLADFIINENEFRIPFIGNGLNVDDISSGSNSQICMMGMVINLVLLHQASTKYNIAYLDEIDAGLDHKNRFEFINALYRSIPLLEIDQLFMISHSMEADTSSVDIIKLQGYEDFEDTVQMGNIIFDINNCTN
jgi:DNA repair exonuclease SbcCD ATPase subunit